MSKLGIAVFGCGRWGPNHIRNFSSFPDVDVRVAVDPNKDQLKKVAALFPGLATTTSVDKALQDPDVDAVVIAAPVAIHFKLVSAALKAGKHVLCEKPLCERSAQARKLGALARKKRRVLMVGHVFLFNGGLAKVKQYVDDGDLGRLFYMSATRTNLGPIRQDVNAAYDLASHDISIFNWMIGKRPNWVSATGGAFLRKRIEDVTFLTLKYPGGACANIHASWLNPKKVRQIIVVGSRKMVTWDDLDLSHPVAVYDKGANYDIDAADYGEFLRLSLWDGEVRLPKIKLEEPLRAQARAFLKAVQTGRVEYSGPEFSEGVVRTLEAASRSLRLNGKPIRV